MDYESTIVHGEILIISSFYQPNAEWLDCLKKNLHIQVSITESLSAHHWYEPDRTFRLILYDDIDRYQNSAEILTDCLKMLDCGRVALLSTKKNLTLELDALEAGLHGVLYRNPPYDTLLKGIMAILVGELWYRRSVLSNMIARWRINRDQVDGPANPPKRKNVKSANNKLTNGRNVYKKFSLPPDMPILTQRELSILNLLAGGATNQEIAVELCVSNHTVKSHIYRIYKKTSSRNRIEAINWAKRLNLYTN